MAARSLNYYARDHSFSFPYYEDLAANVLDSYLKQGISPAQEAEIRRCLEEGLLLPDWLTEGQLSSAGNSVSAEPRDRHHHNYQIVMKRIHQYYAGTGMSF